MTFAPLPSPPIRIIDPYVDSKYPTQRTKESQYNIDNEYQIDGVKMNHDGSDSCELYRFPGAPKSTLYMNNERIRTGISLNTNRLELELQKTIVENKTTDTAPSSTTLRPFIEPTQSRSHILYSNNKSRSHTLKFNK